MEQDYILTYWWLSGPVQTGSDPMGVSVRRGASLTQAIDKLARDVARDHPEVHAEHYEIMSAVVLVPCRDATVGLRVKAVSLDVEGAETTYDAHVSSYPFDGTEKWASETSPNLYAVTGTESYDNFRFVQVLHARDLDQALLLIQEYMTGEGKHSDSGDVLFWSAVELFPDESAKVWWLGGKTRGYASLELVAELGAPSGIGDALQEINRHRAGMGMRPLDPVTAGWTGKDIRDEAERIARLHDTAAHLMH